MLDYMSINLQQRKLSGTMLQLNINIYQQHNINKVNLGF